MPYFTEAPETFLPDLEAYLEQGPKVDDNQRLVDLVKRLKELESSTASEKVVQLLGTAVGAQRTPVIHRNHRLAVADATQMPGSNPSVTMES